MEKKEEIFMKKFTTTRALLTLDEKNELMITYKEVNVHAPINRVLDEVGFYDFDIMTVNNHKYFVISDPKERDVLKTKLLIAKMNLETRSVTDICDDDLDDCIKIACKLMDINDLMV